MALLRRSPIVSVLVGVLVLALVGFGVYRVVHRVANIGSDSATGGGDSDSLYRAGNFGTAVKAVKGEIGAGGDVLELRIEAKRAKFTVRDGKSEDASGFLARAGDPSSLSDFGVDVVGQGTLADQSIPISDLAATALTRMEAQAHKRDPDARLDTIQFFTLQVDAGDRKPTWRMNVHGQLYLANLDGRNFHSPGEGAGTLADPELTTTERNALKLSHCISAAQGDIDKIQRCQRTYLK
jgi:hypothetical protein